MVGSIVSFLVVIAIVLLILKLIGKSVKTLIGVLVNAVIGFVILFVLSLIGVPVSINWISSLIVGFLGVPGLIIVLVLQLVFHILV